MGVLKNRNPVVVNCFGGDAARQLAEEDAEQRQEETLDAVEAFTLDDAVEEWGVDTLQAQCGQGGESGLTYGGGRFYVGNGNVLAEYLVIVH